MAPHKPNEMAARLSKYLSQRQDADGSQFDVDVYIVDANDIACTVLGKSRKDLPDEFAELIFADNPLDQSDQQTPIAIIRPISEESND
jgi:hypothetical protein